MKKSYPASAVAILVFAAIVGFILSALFIKGPTKNISVPKVTALPASFPDVKNDPVYNSFINQQAIDPTQVVHVGGSNNSSPFNGTQ